MCGEHPRAPIMKFHGAGSSPHVRGALTQLLSNTLWTGIIPACAGSTDVFRVFVFPSGDHPRMCGEHLREIGQETVQQGSSPHVRGARIPSQRQGRLSGIIPACAGSTQLATEVSAQPWDHPRMCGEHTKSGMFSRTSTGSSPHVRGAQHPAQERRGLCGIIPACAGSTPPSRRTSCPTRDHPRMCGEHRLRSLVIWMALGSSPHVRGAPHAVRAGPPWRGIIPACAGSTRRCTTVPERGGDHPRMCGEHTSKIA